ncbi:MAG: YdaS family helix-turn-helix protein [Rhizobacter sp.]
MSRVARAAGLQPSFLSQIATGKREVPAERGAALERACAHEVRRWDLRPHDWHLIWPELIGTVGAPPEPEEKAA